MLFKEMNKYTLASIAVTDIVGDFKYEIESIVPIFL